ncbi:MAG: hypothetical protein SOT76_03200 [Eubacteriales bacterium]|nr:hypothetical protein [Eubacteriales bacterium]
MRDKNEKNKRKSRKCLWVKKLWTKYRTVIVITMIVLLFPLVIGAIYMIPIPRLIALDARDLLSFYGTALGLLGTYIVYTEGKKKEQYEKNEKLRPRIAVGLKLVDTDEGVFELTVYNNTELPLRSVFLYDIYATVDLGEKEKFYLAFDDARNKEYNGSRMFNVEVGDREIDEDGYPRYIQIFCNDAENRMWECLFDLRSLSGEKYYCLRTVELM